MKTALIFLGTGMVLLTIFFSRAHIRMETSTIDINVHDTYFIVDSTIFIGFIVLLLGTLFSIGGLLGTKAGNKIYWILFLLFAGVDAYYIFKYIHLLNS